MKANGAFLNPKAMRRKSYSPPLVPNVVVRMYLCQLQCNKKSGKVVGST